MIHFLLMHGHYSVFFISAYSLLSHRCYGSVRERPGCASVMHSPFLLSGVINPYGQAVVSVFSHCLAQFIHKCTPRLSFTSPSLLFSLTLLPLPTQNLHFTPPKTPSQPPSLKAFGGPRLPNPPSSPATCEAHSHPAQKCQVHVSIEVFKSSKILLMLVIGSSLASIASCLSPPQLDAYHSSIPSACVELVFLADIVSTCPSMSYIHNFISLSHLDPGQP
jgi:hypothetical protein